MKDCQNKFERNSSEFEIKTAANAANCMRAEVTASGFNRDHLTVTANAEFDKKCLLLVTPTFEFKIPLDKSRVHALPGFEQSAHSYKTGFDGFVDSVIDVFKQRDLHSTTRELARSGLTPDQRRTLLDEEKQVKDYNDRVSASPNAWAKETPPKTPTLDELDRRTIALEHSIANSAKAGFTPLQIAQLESGSASAALQKQYDQRLISIVTDYEKHGEVPAHVYKKVISDSEAQRRKEEAQAGKQAADSCHKNPLVELLPALTIDGSFRKQGQDQQGGGHSRRFDPPIWQHETHRLGLKSSSD